MADIINASQYNIYEKELEIAKKYMFPDPNNVSDYDINFLRVGQMGYVTDVMAMSLKDALLYNMMTKSEAILYTAKTANAIYNWAKMYNVEIPMAKPSAITAQIYVNRRNIVENALSGEDSSLRGHSEWRINNNHKYVVLDRTTPFYTDTGIPFSLAKSIVFEVDPSTDSVKCYEASEEPLFSYLDTVHATPDVYTTVDKYSGDIYINVVLKLYQFETTKIAKNITSGKISDIKVLSFDFDDDLCGFNAFYEGEGSTYKLQTYFNRLTDLSSGVRGCYFNLTDENSIQLTFSGMPTAFRPKPNTTVYVNAYTTNGASGNFDYSGQFSYTFRNSFANSDISINCVATPDASATGGTDSPSLSEIKQKIISAISTKDVIITENDLNEYFTNLSNASGKLTFVKKRDDLIRRIFTAYALLYYNEVGYDGDLNIRRVAPTNTVDVIWDSSKPCINPYSDTFYSDDSIIGTKTPMRVSFKDASVTGTSGQFKYVCPFFMGYDISGDANNTTIVPFYIDPYTTGYSRLAIDYDQTRNKNSDFENNIVPQNITISRDMSSRSSSYSITISTVSSIPMDDVRGKLTVTCELKDSAGSLVSITSSPSDITYSGSDEIFQITLGLNVESDNSFSIDSAGFNCVTFKSEGATTNSSLREIVSATITYNYDGNPLAVAKSIDNIRLFKSLGNVMNSAVSKFNKYSSISLDNLIAGYGNNTPVYVYDKNNYYVKYNKLQDMFNTITADEMYEVASSPLDAGTTYYVKGADAYEVVTPAGSEDQNDTTYYTRKSGDYYTLSGDYFVKLSASQDTQFGMYYIVKPEVASLSLNIVSDVSYLIRSVPMIGKAIADNYSIELAQQMTNYCNELISNSDKLETSTQMDLKLYNTYGYSVLSGEEINGSSEGQTNATNISINLKIMLNPGYVIEQNSETDQQIRSFIQGYINTANDEGNFSLSTLIAALQLRFMDIIKSIKYVNTIQDSYIQYIKINTYDPENTTLVPEYISVYEDGSNGNNKHGLTLEYISNNN